MLTVLLCSFWRPMVTVCTARFSIQQLCVLPTQCIYVFCVDLRTEIISLQSINWLVFVTETECVYCAVRTECLYIVQADFLLESVRHRFYLRYVCRINLSSYSRYVYNHEPTKIFRMLQRLYVCIKWWYSRSLWDAHPLSVWHCPPEFRLLSLRRWRQEVLRNRDTCLPNYVGP